MTRTHLRSCHHPRLVIRWSQAEATDWMCHVSRVTCHETRVSPAHHLMRSSRIHQSRIQHDSVIHISTVLHIALKVPSGGGTHQYISQYLPSAACPTLNYQHDILPHFTSVLTKSGCLPYAWKYIFYLFKLMDNGYDYDERKM